MQLRENKKNTHVILEKIVADVNAIGNQVRFDGWQTANLEKGEVQ